MPENTLLQKKIAKENTNIMPALEVIDKVTVICKANGVRRPSGDRYASQNRHV